LPQIARRPRLKFDAWPSAVYAIGDVHGCIDQLQKLEALIVADGTAFPGEKWIVTLGDYIDRGVASPAVLDHLMTPPPAGFQRFALLGNHEKLLLDFLDNPPANLDWLEWGGVATAKGYGLADPAESWRQSPRRFAEALRPLIPPGHLELLHNLPTCLSLPGFFFVHAGIRPGVSLEAQDDEDLIWIRAPFLRAKVTPGLTIVHGHTPVEAVDLQPGRIDIDTGCVFTGVLSCLRVLPDGGLKLLQARGKAAIER